MFDEFRCWFSCNRHFVEEDKGEIIVVEVKVIEALQCLVENMCQLGWSDQERHCKKDMVVGWCLFVILVHS